MNLRTIASGLLLCCALAARNASGAEPQDAAPQVPAPVTALTIEIPGAPAGLKITLDGLPIAPEPGASIAVRPGAHRIEVRAPGYFTEGRNVNVPPAQNLKVSFELTPKAVDARTIAERARSEPPADEAEPTHPQAYAGITIALLGGMSAIASGIVFAVYEEGNRSDLRRLIESGRCREEGDTTVCEKKADSDTVEALDETGYQLLVSSVALGAGAVFLAAAGVALAVTAPSGKPSRTVRVAPILGPDTFGAQLRYLW